MESRVYETPYSTQSGRSLSGTIPCDGRPRAPDLLGARFLRDKVLRHEVKTHPSKPPGLLHAPP
jgi:hypothetical protein